jgi:DNA-binding XRE family transcriptional regulator
MKSSRSHSYVVTNRISELADAIKKERKITKEQIFQEIADYCGVSVATIKQIRLPLDKGAIYPSLPVAFKIAEYFGLSVDEIFLLKEKE